MQRAGRIESHRKVRGAAVVTLAGLLAGLLAGCAEAETEDPGAGAERPSVQAPPAADGDVFVMPDSVPDSAFDAEFPGLDATQVAAVQEAWEHHGSQVEEFRVHGDKIDGHACTTLDGAWIAVRGDAEEPDEPHEVVIGVPPTGADGPDVDGAELASGFGCTSDEVVVVDLETSRVTAGVDAARALFGTPPAGAS